MGHFPTERIAFSAGLLLLPLLGLATACGSKQSSQGGAGAAPGTGGTGGSSAVGGAGATSGNGGSASGNGGTTAGDAGTSPGAGGSAASGGGGAGGSASGMGGSTSGASGSAGTGGSANPSGSFTLDVSLSTAIGTVGIVTWSLDAPVDSAIVEFGRDPSAFEFEATVDLTEPNHRSLLLGMKPNTMYSVRVTATGGGKTYVSEVASIQTGFLANGLPVQTITDHDAGALYAGGAFTVACSGFDTFGNSGSNASWVFVFDRDGEQVWAYDLSKTSAVGCTRARMSYDGKYMWAGNFGNTTSDGALTRITMDGLSTPENFSLPGRSHDFAILPNDHIVYFARNDGGASMSPESIEELDPSTGTSTLIYDELTDFEALISTRGGHTNSVNYVPELNAISFSMYFANTVALVSYPEGKLMAAFGGDNTTFSSMSWSGEHGHDVRADHIDVFNNNGTNGGASVLRFQYDLQAKTATEQPDYSSGFDSPAFGDVREQPNGNFFVTYSTSSVMHELDPSLQLLRQIETNVTIGYTEHRATLYGKPPPYDR